MKEELKPNYYSVVPAEIKYDDDFYLKALEVRKNLKIISICSNWKLLYITLI